MHRLGMSVLAFTLLACAGAADAHPRLLAANPAAGSQVAAPSSLSLSFSETLVGRFSQLSLAGPGGRRMALGPSTLSPDRKQLSAQVKGSLPPGAYRLSWRAVSTDTHRVQGGYGFTVKR